MAAKLGWANLLITAGLGASVAALGTFVDEIFRESREQDTERLREMHDDKAQSCQMAQALLQEHAISSYVEPSARQALLRSAMQRANACLEK